MNVAIQHPCPQCGGMVELEESDRMLACPWCGVKSCLSTLTPSLVFPPGKPYDALVYVPYLRFRGCVYFCTANAIAHQVVDTSRLGVPRLTILPPSLGLRPQAMKYSFATSMLEGTFLRCLLSVDDVVELAGCRHSFPPEAKMLHRACIGETVSRIYQPLFFSEDKLGDAVTGNWLARLPKGMKSLARAVDPAPPLDLNFFPALCPQCGWDLAGEKDSVVFTCANCNTAWEASGQGFSRVNVVSLRGADRDSLFLPFWKIGISCHGIKLESFADLAGLMNLPLAPQPAWRDREIALLAPAFKVRPKIYLRLAGQLSGTVKELAGEEFLPNRCHPVNMPASEVVESLKVILGHCAANRKKILPTLPSISITATTVTLFYLPFADAGYDLRQPETRVVLNRQILAWGKFL